VVAAGCAGAGSSPADGRTELTVFGAASLRNALEALAAAYEDTSPGVTFTISTDSSAALATQIQQGAPADVFLSADTTNPQKLADAGLAAGDPIVFALNALTVIVPSGNPAGIQTPADLARPGVRVIAAGDEVPITRYAVQLVENLAAEPGYPADFVAAYTSNIVSREDNVRAVAAKIELGEGDAGIVYATDAIATDSVEAIEVPDSANVPARYAGVVVAASANREAAEAFLAWVAGPQGQAVLADFGFRPPGS
jgi:molybdate transport system substrate-binding protein